LPVSPLEPTIEIWTEKIAVKSGTVPPEGKVTTISVFGEPDPEVPHLSSIPDGKRVHPVALYVADVNSIGLGGFALGLAMVLFRSMNISGRAVSADVLV